MPLKRENLFKRKPFLFPYLLPLFNTIFKVILVILVTYAIRPKKNKRFFFTEF